MISSQDVNRHLDRIKQVANIGVLSDIHVHPFEVMCSSLQYKQSICDKRIYSTGSEAYLPPSLGPLSDGQDLQTQRPIANDNLRRKMALLHFRRIYTHIGPGVLSDHMSISGIGRMLLLPVSDHNEAGTNQMDLLDQLFGADNRFSFGFCVPNDIPNIEIENVVRGVVDRYKITTLKIHPNVTGIDLSTSTGIERVECILQASNKNNLKVIVHGGFSLDLLLPQFSTFAVLENLKKINWGITDQTVVIAHAGFFGHSLPDAQNLVLPLLKLLLRKHDNLMVDTSGLDEELLDLLLANLDLNRILFGSDALYFSPWSSLVKIMVALEKRFSSPEEPFHRITVKNPDKHIFAV